MTSTEKAKKMAITADNVDHLSVWVRVTDMKQPLDHSEQDLRASALKALGLRDEELLSLVVFRRGFDARKKNDIHFISFIR